MKYKVLYITGVLRSTCNYVNYKNLKDFQDI